MSTDMGKFYERNFPHKVFITWMVFEKTVVMVEEKAGEW
jgi:hypothetical protein